MAPTHKPLLDTLSSLVNDGQTGMLAINDRYGFKAKLYLRAGCVYHAESGDLVGNQAIRAIAKRKAAKTLFVPGMDPDVIARTRFSTDEVLLLFRHADLVWNIFHKAIPGYDAVFELVSGAQYENVEETHRKVLSALDGCRTVNEVIRETGIAEMNVLHVIYFYSRFGLVRLWDPDEEKSGNACRKFIRKLGEELRQSLPSAMMPMKGPITP